MSIVEYNYIILLCKSLSFGSKDLDELESSLKSTWGDLDHFQLFYIRNRCQGSFDKWLEFFHECWGKSFGYPRYLNDIINFFDIHARDFQLHGLTDNILSDRYDIKTKKLMIEVRDGLYSLKNNDKIIKFVKNKEFCDGIAWFINISRY